jgi:hypothetical protein
MTATIDKDGILMIEAETELEAYALSKWADENFTSEENTAYLSPRLQQNILVIYGLEKATK